MQCRHHILEETFLAPSVNHQPSRFTTNSLGLPHAQSFSVCLSSCTYVVCVCSLLYLSVYLCFAHCVFSVLFHISFPNFKTYIYMTVVVPITWFIYQNLFHQHLLENLFMCVNTPMTYTAASDTIQCLDAFVFFYSNPHK